MKIAFIGDPHFDYSTPISRLDNYKDVTLSKLNSILKVCLETKTTHFVMTGDIFNKLDQSMTYMHDLISVFNEFKENGIIVYAIWGNHDLKNNNLNISDKTPLSLLFKTGVIQYLSIDGVDIGDTTKLYGLDFTKMDLVKDIKTNPDKLNLLTMHYATDNTVANESVKREDLTQFDIVVAGHDHMYYEPSGEKPVVLRPGSLVRRTKDAYNLVRKPIMYILDTETREVAEIEIPNVKEAKEVFKNEVFLGTEDLYNFYSKNYNNLFTDDFFSSETTDLGGLIQELPDTVFKESKKAIIDEAIKAGIIIK